MTVDFNDYFWVSELENKHYMCLLAYFTLQVWAEGNIKKKKYDPHPLINENGQLVNQQYMHLLFFSLLFVPF